MAGHHFDRRGRGRRAVGGRAVGQHQATLWKAPTPGPAEASVDSAGAPHAGAGRRSPGQAWRGCVWKGSGSHLLLAAACVVQLGCLRLGLVQPKLIPACRRTCRPRPPPPHLLQTSDMLGSNFAANLIVLVFAFMMMILVNLYTANTGGWPSSAVEGPIQCTHSLSSCNHFPWAAGGSPPACHAMPRRRILALLSEQWRRSVLRMPEPAPSRRCDTSHRPPPACPAAAANLTADRLQNSIWSVADLPGRVVGTWEVGAAHHPGTGWPLCGWQPADPAQPCTATCVPAARTAQ